MQSPAWAKAVSLPGCFDTLARILGEAKGADEEVGRQELKLLHDKNRMMLDVWS